MLDYEKIQKHVRQAKLDRSIFLGDLIASGVVFTYELTKLVGKNIVLATRAVFKGAKNRVNRNKSIFSFDA